MKTQLTLDLEKTLYLTLREQNSYVVEEVVMPDDQGIVDTLSYELNRQNMPIWRCFELKVTKADFHSTAKLSFVGHYNYFVLPKALYDQVIDEIPKTIGVMLYQPFQVPDPETGAPGTLTIVKKPRKQPLQVDEAALTQSFIAALSREVFKAKQVEKGLTRYSTEQLYQALKKRTADYDLYQPEQNLYDQFVEDLQSTAVEEMREELSAVTAAYQQLKFQNRQLRRELNQWEKARGEG